MKKTALLVLGFFPPVFASAAFSQTKSYIASIGQIVQSLTILVMGLALLYFFWGLAKFILSAGDEKKLAEGKSTMIWGVIALFFMSSIWGIVALVGGELGIRSGGIFDVGAPPAGPTAPAGGGLNPTPTPTIPTETGTLPFNPSGRRDCGNFWQPPCN
jgi:hypothetical protein